MDGVIILLHSQQATNTHTSSTLRPPRPLGYAHQLHSHSHSTIQGSLPTKIQELSHKEQELSHQLPWQGRSTHSGRSGSGHGRTGFFPWAVDLRMRSRRFRITRSRSITHVQWLRSCLTLASTTRNCSPWRNATAPHATRFFQMFLAVLYSWKESDNSCSYINIIFKIRARIFSRTGLKLLPTALLENNYT